MNLFTNFVSQFSLFRLLDTAKTNHQTIAIQLENQAISQINAANPKDNSHFSVEKSELIRQNSFIEKYSIKNQINDTKNMR